MKLQAKQAITLSGATAILLLAVGFEGGDLSPSDTTPTRSSRIAPTFRSWLVPSDVSLSSGQRAEFPDRLQPRNGALPAVPKLPQGAVIADATSLTASAGAGVDLLGQANADDPPCVVDPANPCPPAVGSSANSPSPRRTQTTCRPAGIFGQHCFRRIVP